MKTWIYSIAVGLVLTASMTVVVSASSNRTTICHRPGTPAEHTLVVDAHAWPGHRGHGDYLGACRPTPTATPTDSVATFTAPTPTPTATPSPTDGPTATPTTTGTQQGLPTPHITMPPTDTAPSDAASESPSWLYWIVLGVSLVGNFYQALLLRWLKRNPDSLPARE